MELVENIPIYWCSITILWKFQKFLTSGTCWEPAPKKPTLSSYAYFAKKKKTKKKKKHKKKKTTQNWEKRKKKKKKLVHGQLRQMLLHWSVAQLYKFISSEKMSKAEYALGPNIIRSEVCRSTKTTLRKHAYSKAVAQILHYENTPIQIYWKNSQPKTEIFQIKILIFFFQISAQNIDCGYSLEPPRRGGSNEYHSLCVWAEIRKIMYTPVNPSYTKQKWGLRGSKLYKCVFVTVIDIEKSCWEEKQVERNDERHSLMCLGSVIDVPGF